MKLKIIRGFLAVYLALSMAYGGARAAYLTVMAAMEPPEKAQEQIEPAPPASFGADAMPTEPELAEVVIPSPVIQAEDIPEDPPSETPETTPEPSPEESAAPSPVEADSAEDGFSEESAWEEAVDEEVVDDTSAPELTEAPEETGDSEEAYVEAAPPQDVPTLEDYLSQLHCGRCGRNCFLSNPRCRTGKHKAESAAEEYYAEYGPASNI